MSGVSITIQGDREIQAALKRAGVAIESVVRDAVAEIALVHVETAAKQFVPVDTGRLRSSIGTNFLNGGLDAEVGSNVEYAGIVEGVTNRPFNTSGANEPPPITEHHSKRHGRLPHPYLTPAVESARSKADGVVAKYVKRVTG